MASRHVLSVTEVDGAILCAVPAQAWDRLKTKRALPADCLRRAVRVMVPGCIDEDRAAPEPQPTFRIWLGVLKETYESSVWYDVEDAEYTFPVNGSGLMCRQGPDRRCPRPLRVCRRGKWTGSRWSTWRRRLWRAARWSGSRPEEDPRQPAKSSFLQQTFDRLLD